MNCEHKVGFTLVFTLGKARRVLAYRGSGGGLGEVPAIKSDAKGWEVVGGDSESRPTQGRASNRRFFNQFLSAGDDEDDNYDDDDVDDDVDDDNGDDY